jgi:hypothetical protein
MSEPKKPAGGKAGTVGAKISIEHEGANPKGEKLPSGMVKVAGDNQLEINVEKLSRAQLIDQRARMVASDGCISNPGGPSC